MVSEFGFISRVRDLDYGAPETWFTAALLAVLFSLAYYVCFPLIEPTLVKARNAFATRTYVQPSKIARLEDRGDLFAVVPAVLGALFGAINFIDPVAAGLYAAKGISLDPTVTTWVGWCMLVLIAFFTVNLLRALLLYRVYLGWVLALLLLPAQAATMTVAAALGFLLAPAVLLLSLYEMRIASPILAAAAAFGLVRRTLAGSGKGGAGLLAGLRRDLYDA